MKKTALPASLRKHARHILHFDDERSMDNGYILTLVGRSIDPLIPTHVVGGDTLKELSERIDGAYWCGCKECKAAKRKR